MTVFSLNGYGAVFTDVLTGIAATMAGLSFGVTDAAKDNDCGQLSGFMRLDGARSGLIIISAAERDIRVFCSRMLGISQADVTAEEAHDTLCELVNMTAGNAKLRFNETKFMFTLTTPFVVTGNEMKLVMKNSAQYYTCTLGDGDISLKLKIIY